MNKTTSLIISYLRDSRSLYILQTFRKKKHFILSAEVELYYNRIDSIRLTNFYQNPLNRTILGLRPT